MMGYRPMGTPPHQMPMGMQMAMPPHRMGIGMSMGTPPHQMPVGGTPMWMPPQQQMGTPPHQMLGGVPMWLPPHQMLMGVPMMEMPPYQIPQQFGGQGPFNMMTGHHHHHHHHHGMSQVRFTPVESRGSAVAAVVPHQHPHQVEAAAATQRRATSSSQLTAVPARAFTPLQTKSTITSNNKMSAMGRAFVPRNATPQAVSAARGGGGGIARGMNNAVFKDVAEATENVEASAARRPAEMEIIQAAISETAAAAAVGIKAAYSTDVDGEGRVTTSSQVNVPVVVAAIATAATVDIKADEGGTKKATGTTGAKAAANVKAATNNVDAERNKSSGTAGEVTAATVMQQTAVDDVATKATKKSTESAAATDTATKDAEAAYFKVGDDDEAERAMPSSHQSSPVALWRGEWSRGVRKVAAGIALVLLVFAIAVLSGAAALQSSSSSSSSSLITVSDGGAGRVCNVSTELNKIILDGSASWDIDTCSSKPVIAGGVNKTASAVTQIDGSVEAGAHGFRGSAMIAYTRTTSASTANTTGSGLLSSAVLCMMAATLLVFSAVYWLTGSPPQHHHNQTRAGRCRKSWRKSGFHRRFWHKIRDGKSGEARRSCVRGKGHNQMSTSSETKPHKTDKYQSGSSTALGVIRGLIQNPRGGIRRDEGRRNRRNSGLSIAATSIVMFACLGAQPYGCSATMLADTQSLAEQTVPISFHQNAVNVLHVS